MSCWRVMLALAVLLTIAALGLVVTAVATTHWMDTNVDRESLQILAAGNPTLADDLETDPVYFSRQRGMFSTCYHVTDNDTALMQVMENDEAWIDNCIYDEGISSFEYPHGGLGYPPYDTRNHLVRAQISLLLLVALLYVIGLILEVVGMCQENLRKVKVASGLILVASFLLAGGMSMFNVINFYETSSIAILGFPFALQQDPAYDDLMDNTSRSYGYSYFIGWGALACGLLAPLFFCTAMSHAEVGGATSRKAWGNENSMNRHLAEPERPKNTKGQRKKMPLPKTESIYSWGYAGNQKSKDGVYENSLLKNKSSNLIQSGRFFPAGQV